MMVVATNTRTDKKTSHISSVYMQLVGPNPEPRPENEKYVKYWWPAIVYPSPTFGKGFKGAVFHKWAGKKEEEWTSYDVIIDAMSTRTLAELQKYYDKGAKQAKNS